MPVTLVKADTKHLYEVKVEGGGSVDVQANTRTEAGKRARDAGYKVLSVNMIG